MTERYEVCPVDELPPGEREIVEIGDRSIGVFNVDGEYYALNNVCPHQMAPLCQGDITGEVVSSKVGEYEVVREGEIIQCPWHGWKFDLATGRSVFNPHALRTRTYDVEVETTTREVEESAVDIDDRRESETTEDDSEPGDEDDEDERQIAEYGTALAGDEPPVDTYPVEIEEDVVVLYV